MTPTRTAKAKRPASPERKPRRRSRQDGRAAVDRWIERGDQVTALFECALRGCIFGDRTVAERSVYELMEALDNQGRAAGSRVLEHFDSCLTELARGDFEEAFQALAMLRDNWIEALDALRRDCDRADHLH